MLRVNMNENVTAHKTPERQAAVQGKLSTGRVVRQSLATARTPDRMAGASSTSRQTITHHSGAGAVKRTADSSTEAASAKRPKGPEKTTHLEQFKEQVDDAVRKLCDERNRNKPDSLSFCLNVSNTYTMLSQNLNETGTYWRPATRKKCRQHARSEMAALYHENLDEILNFFQDQATAGYGWMYADKLDQVAKGFAALECEIHNAKSHKAVLAKVWNLYLDQDLKYLKYLKGFPNVSYSASRTVKNIVWMTSPRSPSCTLELLSNESRKSIKEQAESLYREIIHPDMNHSDAGKKKEDVTHKATDAMMKKRKHHDQIITQVHNLHSHSCDEKESGRSSGSSLNRKQIDFLERLSKLHKEYNKQVNNPATILFKDLIKLTTRIVNEVQNRLEKGAYDNDQELKKEALLLVSNMEKDGWLNRGCKDPYSDCAQSQSTVIPAGRKSETISDKIHDRINRIYTIVRVSTPGKCMVAVKQMKQLCDDLEGNPQGFTERESIGIQNHLQQAMKVIYATLFAPVLNEYKQHPQDTPRDIEQMYAAMHRHKDSIIKLNPYVFVFDKFATLRMWQHAAFCAWHHDIERLSHQTSFSEDDVDNLLDLKDVVQTMLTPLAESHLLATLTNLFQSMRQANPGTALIEKVTKLSKWIDDLDMRYHRVSQTLHEYNKEWREKYVSKGRRATTSSYALTARKPSPMCSGGVPGAFPEAFDCPPGKMLQNVPYMQQSSIPFPCPGVPTLAPCGAFQQSASSIPIAQSAAGSTAAGSRPVPSPWFGWPVPPCMPVPAYSRVGFHQPPTGLWTNPAGASQQQYEPRSTMPFKYRSGYPFSSNIR